MHFLDDFDGLIDQEGAENAIGFIQDFLQYFLDVLLFIRKRDDSDYRSLPRILMLQLRHGHVELPPQLILQAAQNLPNSACGAHCKTAPAA